MATLTMRHLSRWYGQVVGVSDINVEIGPGVTGLLGLNGAGKSTLLNLLSGHLIPSRGGAFVDRDEITGNWRIYQRIGFCPDLEKGFSDLSGRAFLMHHMRVGGYSRRAARARADALLERHGLADAARRRAAGYSKGMKQRLKLAFADIHNPEVLLLDEPLNGLDPPGRAAMVRQIHEWGQAGRTVLVSSHILQEVESLTRQVILIHRGRLLAEGDVSEIREQMEEIPRVVLVGARNRLAVRQALAGMENVVSLEDQPRDGGLKIETLHLPEFLQEFHRRVIAEQWNITRLESPDERLESVFHDLLERQGGTRSAGS